MKLAFVALAAISLCTVSALSQTPAAPPPRSDTVTRPAATPPADTSAAIPGDTTSSTPTAPSTASSRDSIFGPAAAPAESTTASAMAAAPSSMPPAPREPTDSVFLTAQRMASEGQGDSARIIVQRQLEATPTGSPRYVEALYWRAVVAATAADAERDLRRIVIEYPLSPRSEDALMRLAQLEMTRGENDQAFTHLQRVVLEHPNSPNRSRASFWMARVLFDQSKTVQACRALGDATRTTPPGDVEQRNQIAFWQQRCDGIDTSAVAVVAPPVAAESSPGSSAAARSGATPSTSSTPSTTPAPSARHTAFTIQVAAYSTKGGAEHMRSSLAARGYDARVVGSTKPYRVRVGRYATRAEADRAAARMKAKKIPAYVTEAEPR